MSSKQNNQQTLKDIIKSEYARCAADPVYFMIKYVKIQHPIRGTISFALYPFQEQTLKDFHQFDFNIVLKSRQMGISTLVSAYSLWLMLFHTDKNILVISKTQEVAKEIVSKVRFANDNLPSWLKVQSLDNNKLSLKLKNGSRILAVSSASDAGRSFALSLLIIDEAAFIDKIDEIWTAAYPTLSTGGRAIVLSTPNGVGNLFHKMWKDAEAKKNNFNTIKLPWNLHPERDQIWRDKQTEVAKSPKEAAQECFDGETRVFTNKGLVKIKDIKIGDRVLTHTGNFEAVARLYKKETEDYSEIRSSINTNVRWVTNNHPFYTKEKSWIELKNLENKQLCNVFPEQIQLDNSYRTIDLFKETSPNFFKYKLCNNDSQFFINDRKFKTVHNRFVKNDYKLGYILGCYLSEGWIQDNDNRIDFSFNWGSEKSDWPDKLCKYIKDVFDLDNFQYRKCGNNSGHITFCSQILCKTLKYLSDGEDCYTKRLSRIGYSLMNYDFFKGIADGCFVGDGMILDEYNKQFSTRSEELMYDVKYILYTLNIGVVSQRKKYPVDPAKESICYILSILNTKNIHCENRNVSSLLEKSGYKETYRFPNECGLDSGFYYAQIIKNKKSDEHPNTITVYNLEVDNDHSYVTEHFVVHNCDCDFLTSGTTVVDLAIIEYYKETLKRDPIECRGIDRSEWIFEYPDYSRTYIVCADVARGDGQDYSAYHVLDAETLNQCVEYKGQIDLVSFGHQLVNVATMYNKALLIVENTGVGFGTLQTIVDSAYPNTFYSTVDLKYVEVQRQLVTKYYTEEKKMVPGFSTTLRTRPLIISRLEHYFRDKAVNIFSTRTLAELETFIWDKGKAVAMEGYNDDLVMALGIGLWVRDTALRLKFESMSYNRAMMGKIERIQYTGSAPVFTSRTAFAGQESWNMKIGRDGRTESLKWLL